LYANRLQTRSTEKGVEAAEEKKKAWYKSFTGMNTALLRALHKQDSGLEYMLKA
jgi:hypothetical protein